jgi:elongator complex protein 3
VYGPEVPLSQKRPETVQHRGLGKALMAEAERIARGEFNADLIAVLSGVGAREYYRSEFGYCLDSHYMVKDLAA